jgi:gliding motility-associated-like protein
VQVKDTTAPLAPILADVNGQCSVTVSVPTTDDDCAGTITATTSDPLSYDIQGNYTITWTFDDGNGNSSTATQNVQVKNTISAPVSGGDQIACVSNNLPTLTATATAPAEANIVWYNSEFEGIIISQPTLNTLGSVTYYAESIHENSGCRSLTRTPVTLTIDECSIGLIKTVAFEDNNNDGLAQVGEILRYNFNIKNTGKVAFTDVMVHDTKEGLILSGDSINLEAGETNSTEFSAIYKLTQEDITLGKVYNQATVTATTIFNSVVTDVSSESSFNEDSQTILDVAGCAINVHNAISLNEDGRNDTFHISGIECYPDNTVEIYNRWGLKVFEQDHYNNTDKVFTGLSDGRSTINKSSALPSGTYFYVLKYKDISNGNIQEKSGYLYITR